MANNYLEFSEVLSHLSQAEEQWLEGQLEVVYMFGDEEYIEDEIPAELSKEDADRVCCRAYRDMEDYDDGFCDGCGFSWKILGASDAPSDAQRGCHMWIYSEDYGELTRIAHLVQKFFKKYRPQACWAMSYAMHCSKPRVGEFGGGAMFVTANEVKWANAYDFIDEQETIFKSQQKAQDESSGTGRYVLYDFDSNDLASTRVYADRQEAVDDAAQLDNVIVVPLPLETTNSSVSPEEKP